MVVRGVVFVVLIGCADSAELGGRFACEPGTGVSVGCTEALGRECGGRPIMSVCDGVIDHEECLPSTPMPPLLVVRNPPACPMANVTCPASGRIAVGISQGGSGPYTCTWAHTP